MKKFKLSIFKGHDLKQTKIVEVSSKEELKAAKNGFWSESPYRACKGRLGVWMGVKKIR